MMYVPALPFRTWPSRKREAMFEACRRASCLPQHSVFGGSLTKKSPRASQCTILCVRRPLRQMLMRRALCLRQKGARTSHLASRPRSRRKILMRSLCVSVGAACLAWTSALSLGDENDDLAAIRSSTSWTWSTVTPESGCRAESVADIMCSTDEAKSLPSRFLHRWRSLSRVTPRQSARPMMGSRRLSWSSNTRSGLRCGKRHDKNATPSCPVRGMMELCWSNQAWTI